MTLQHDTTIESKDDIFHELVNKLFSYLQNNINVLGKTLEHLKPDAIDDCFIRHRMWNSRRCYLYDVIKHPLTVFTESIEGYSQQFLTMQTLRQEISKDVFIQSKYTRPFLVFVIEATCQKLMELESLETVKFIELGPSFHSLNLEHRLTNRKSIKSVHYHMFRRKYDNADAFICAPFSSGGF